MTERETAAAMLIELQGCRLVVMKWRKDDVWIRGAISCNPEWYQRLCAQFEHRRKRYPKPRTVIRRVDVERTLKRISEGKRCDGLYAERLMPFVREEAELRRDVPHTHTHRIAAV